MEFEVSQPDGSTFMAHTRGDEFQGWVETNRGFTIAQDRTSGRWEYAERGPDGRLRPSGLAVDPRKGPPAGTVRGLKPERSGAAGRFFKNPGKGRPDDDGGSSIYQGPSSGGTSQSGSVYLAGGNNWDPVPVSGNINVLIIMVGFADRALVTTPSDLNPLTFQTTGGVDSLKNYYTDNSFGTLNIVPLPHSQSGSPDGIIAVNLTSNHPNYGGNITYSAESAWMDAALAEASAYVDFPSLDTNSDTDIDNTELVVYFVMAGYEASGTSKTPSIWAHYMESGLGLNVDGVTFHGWGVNGELNHYNHLHPMGAMAHEMGHLMCGLPDLYDTSNVNKGMGGYSLMAYGSWGRRASETQDVGNLPVSLDAWCRQYLGWSNPRTPATAGTYSFPAALSATDAPLKLINTDIDATEYFLVENRYNTDWDLGMEGWLGAGWGGGLLIQHIDITVGTPGNNDINRYNYDGLQGVLVEEADSSFGSLMDNTATAKKQHLFYSGNNDAFTATSSPNNLLYDGYDTGRTLTSISTRSQNMSAYVDSQLMSNVTYPKENYPYFGMNHTITGMATSGLGTTLTLVEISIDGGPWTPVTGTASWTYDWIAPGPGLYNIRSRATDSDTNVEVPGAGVNVYVRSSVSGEQLHYEWDWWFSGDCADCHNTVQTFLQTDYLDSEDFCYTCHNTASLAHDLPFVPAGHGVMASITSTGITLPTYGNYTTGETDNRLYANLPGGMVTCITCHNVMQNTEDVARVWELTTTSDNLTYTMQNGSWDTNGHYEPKVYRDTSLWSGPAMAIDRKAYLVDESEYEYDPSAGTITFISAQDPLDYIYVTLDYPSLRVSTVNNRLCSECHTQQTHQPAGYEFNCLDCHSAHGTNNTMLVRETINPPATGRMPVVFVNYTGTTASFSNTGGAQSGPCEVCHTQTLYHKQDRTGQSHYDGEDCTGCHSHASGFPK